MTVCLTIFRNTYTFTHHASCVLDKTFAGFMIFNAFKLYHDCLKRISKDVIIQENSICIVNKKLLLGMLP